MSLESLVAALVASEPFERLLLARYAPGGRAGRDGRGLRARGTRDGARTSRPRHHPGPARGRGVGRGRRRVHPGPSRAAACVGGVPVRAPVAEPGGRGAAGGDGPAVARRRSARGRRAGGRGRPRDRPDHGDGRAARARHGRRGRARRLGGPPGRRSGTTGPTWSSGAASSPSAAAWSTSSRPTSAARSGSSSGATRSNRSGEFVPSTQLSSDRVERATVGPARELIVDDDVRERARAAAASVGDDRVADLLAADRRRRPAGGDRRGARPSCGTRCPRRPSCSPRARGSSSPRRDARSGACDRPTTTRRPWRRRSPGRDLTSCGRRTMRSATAPSCTCPPSRKGRTSRSAAGVPRPAIRAPWLGRRATLLRSGTAWSSRPTATVRSTAPARCSAISSWRGSRRRSQRGSSSVRAR